MFNFTEMVMKGFHSDLLIKWT